MPSQHLEKESTLALTPVRMLDNNKKVKILNIASGILEGNRPVIHYWAGGQPALHSFCTRGNFWPGGLPQGLHSFCQGPFPPPPPLPKGQNYGTKVEANCVRFGRFCHKFWEILRTLEANCVNKKFVTLKCANLSDFYAIAKNVTLKCANLSICML